MILFFICRHLSGDDGDVYWRLDLLKTHLSAELTMPYFSPARCGGFHLAADAHDLIFSIYMLLRLIIPNSMWAIKIGNLILSVILVSGIYQWLKLFQIRNRNVRVFTAFLSAFAGYWMVNLTQGGHVWGHGFAYTPWILVYVEKILRNPVQWTQKYLRRIFVLIFLFFLLINSGYYWLQVAVPILIIRFILEIIWPPENIIGRLKRTSMLGLIGLCAILLSWPRLGGVFEFQIRKFPRLDAPHFPIIHDIGMLLQAYWISFFDGNVVKKAISVPMLNVWWDYCDFIGLTALIPLTIGVFTIKNVFKNKLFIALALATIYQFFLTYSVWIAEFVRVILPPFKQIMW